jgi:hypothetical protein
MAKPGAVDLSSLSPGSLIDVETKRRRYQIECLGGNSIRICGHPDYCPTPVPAHLYGSINKDGLLESGMIERDMRLMFFLDDRRPVTTSKVVSVHIDTSSSERSRPSIQQSGR